MTEKEKNILNQELWVLTALDFEATKHALEIGTRMLKCVAREEADEMTPNKHKVVEEIALQWKFVRILREDLLKIAEKLGKREIVPAAPELVIDDSLWDIGNSGTSDRLYEVNEKISDFQSAMQDCAFKLQEACG